MFITRLQQSMLYADVIFNLRIDKSFTYKIPNKIALAVQSGQRVLAPFGKRELTGIIVHLTDSKPTIECKDIIDVLDEKPLLNQEMLRFTQWVSQYYLSSWGSTCQLALPKGLDKKSNIFVHLNEVESSELHNLTVNQRHLFDIIYANPGKTTIFYKKKFGSASFYTYLRILEKHNLIVLHKEVSTQRVQKKMVRSLFIKKDLIDKLRGMRYTADLIEILRPLAGKTVLYSDFRSQTDLSVARIKRLISLGVISVSETEDFRSFESEYSERVKKINLNPDQIAAVQTIITSIKNDNYNVFLLFGVTGSGKTQVYLESIKVALDNHKSVIVLIPEISLTPQTVARFRNFFGQSVHVFHSRMSLGERYDTWRNIKASKTSIVIGPRSALFLPVNNLGMIIVDEEHDGSYKQDGQSPRYHARDMAIFRAKMNKAVVVLGSATPSMESYHNAKSNKFHLVELKHRVKNIGLPHVHIIDLKRTDKKSKRNKLFSPLLQEKIHERLHHREQIILLQNRRGFSSMLQCKDCGYTAKCANCDIYLTFHTSSNNLQCHYCGYSISASSDCPRCGGFQIQYQGEGTQKVEKEIHHLFPEARVLRMDVDTTRGKNAHASMFNSFRKGDADILLGTQMIAKGLDFENVSLVGVISADIGLTFPDFRASERVFQLLTQVAGRSGRSKIRGEVVIQTNMAKHYALSFAKEHDFEGFFNQELIYREEMSYPPFSRLIKLGIHSDSLLGANQIAKEIVRELRKKRQSHFSIIGPAPAPILRLKNKYRWQIILKLNSRNDPSGKHTRLLLKKITEQGSFRAPKDVDIIIDVDPLEMM